MTVVTMTVHALSRPLPLRIKTDSVLPYITTLPPPRPRAIVMATTPLNVSASDSKSQTEAQDAGIEMQAPVPAVDSDDAPVGSSDAAAGPAEAQVQPSVFVASPGPTPSDAAES